MAVLNTKLDVRYDEKYVSKLPLGIKYKRYDKTLPGYYKKIKTDAGYDLYATEDKWIWPFQVTKVQTNLACEIPDGFFGRVSGRSGTSLQGLLCIPGTIDTDFRGFMSVIMTRIGLWPKKVKKGDRIAQLIIMPCCKVNWEESDELTETERADNGFGHTGVS